MQLEPKPVVTIMTDQPFNKFVRDEVITAVSRCFGGRRNTTWQSHQGQDYQALLMWLKNDKTAEVEDIVAPGAVKPALCAKCVTPKPAGHRGRHRIRKES